MGKVDAFTLPGIEAWFNSSDHMPPHIHVKRRGEWEIRVFFLECAKGHLAYNIKWGSSPSAKQRSDILDSVLQHRPDLLKEWEAKVCPSN
ncbi:MAG TPA: DUF4160 domain-containing protein [Terriglobales bacterium]|nr:DUF4160 domain-containing protein [Terriglobales bacterium]